MTTEVLDGLKDTNSNNVSNATLDNKTETKHDEVKTSSYEISAREMGWRPKEEWQGEPDKWRDAKEFVERGELYNKIDSVSRELKETRKALKMLQEHHTKVKEVEYNRAVEELKAAQKRHLEEGNADEYLKTTELLTDLKAEQKARQVVEEVTPKQTPGIDPRFIAWTQENQWYEKNSEMRNYADIIGQGYAHTHPNIDPVEVLKYVTREVKARFKDNFENPNRSKSTVEGGGPNQGKPASKGKDVIELDDDERRVMNTFVRQGIMTKDEYMEQVRLMRGGK